VYAGGLLLICGCTHVVAVPDVTFSLPEVKRGLWPFQVMHSLLQIMPQRQVLDFCMRGKSMNAEQAEKAGLVSNVVEKENLDAEVQSLVNDILQYSPTAIRLGLETFDKLKSMPVAQAHGYLKTCFFMAVQSEDAKEGMAAFAEKRKPVWKGK
jgi:enoyl-CoA hydratase/carnithine racemase